MTTSVQGPIRTFFADTYFFYSSSGCLLSHHNYSQGNMSLSIYGVQKLPPVSRNFVTKKIVLFSQERKLQSFVPSPIITCTVAAMGGAKLPCCQIPPSLLLHQTICKGHPIFPHKAIGHQRSQCKPQFLA